MAKASKKKTEKVNLDLLEKIMQRLAQVGNQANQTSGANDSLRDEVRLKIGTVQEEMNRAWHLGASRETVAVKNHLEFEKFSKNTTDSMYALRDSTQKGFNRVAEDLQAMKTLVQKLNERISKLESSSTTATDVLRRLGNLEARSRNSDNVDKYVSERVNVALAAIRAMLQPVKILGFDGKTFEYIHPSDLAEIISAVKPSISNKAPSIVYEGAREGIVEIEGVRYKQSADVPRRSVSKIS